MNIYNLNAIIREQVGRRLHPFFDVYNRQYEHLKDGGWLSIRPVSSSLVFMSHPPGEAPPAGCGQVSAALQAEGSSQGTDPTSGPGQGELPGGDDEAQGSSQHKEGADRHPQTGAEGQQTGEPSRS